MVPSELEALLTLGPSEWNRYLFLRDPMGQFVSEEDKQRLIDVSWDPNLLDKSYEGDISIIAKDQKGMLSSISKVCEDMDVRIVGLNARANKDETVRINLTLMIHDRSQIEKLCRSFKSIPGIIEAYRNKG